eukprot:8629678-Heterocapsa_arctica.AAC.1
MTKKEKYKDWVPVEKCKRCLSEEFDMRHSTGTGKYAWKARKTCLTCGTITVTTEPRPDEE